MGLSGLEPPTSRLSGVRSNRLSYKPIGMEMVRFELMTPCLQGRCSPNWATPPRHNILRFMLSFVVPFLQKSISETPYDLGGYIWTAYADSFKESGSHLLSHIVSNIVPSAA